MATEHTAILKLAKEVFGTGICDASTHNEAMDQIDNLVGISAQAWRPPVATFTALPVAQIFGEARVVLDIERIYVWNGAAWVDSAAGALTYIGVWDASTNTPTLVSSVGITGNYYVVSVSGNTNLDGITDWVVGDWAIFNGTIWQKADHTDTVTSVFSRQGAVVAVAGDYAASQVTNDSGVLGVYVDDALDWLKAASPNLHALSHENGGLDEISVAGLSGALADAQTPTAHKDTHKSGGGDALLSTDLIEAVVKRLQESAGPTDLLVGAIPDGAALKRVGTAIVGDVGGTLRSWTMTLGSTTAAGFTTSSTTPVTARIKVFSGTDIFGVPIRACLAAQSSSGNAGYVELYRPSTGTVIFLIGPITALTPTVYQTTTLVNPFPTTEEALEVRVYRGGGAATIKVYDFGMVLY